MNVENKADVEALGGVMLAMMNFEVLNSKEELSRIVGNDYFFKENGEWLIGIAKIKELSLTELLGLTSKIELLIPELN